MNNIDKQYQQLLQDIIDYGIEKTDRTGTGTKSIFGYTIRHNMKDGFPLLTTKRMAWKSIVTELLWFLKGDTNIKFLVDNNCHIWDGDAYKNYLKWFDDTSKKLGVIREPWSKEQYIEQIKLGNVDSDLSDLGPIYGKQWRQWQGWMTTSQGEMGSIWYDQISRVISQLRTEPDSRRMIVNAWNVAELDQMVLPPCHYGFQVYTRKLTTEERVKEYEKRGFIKNIDPLDYAPERAISLMWNQRSVDTFLGLPFNIASYGLLLMLLGKIVNMVPEQLIGNLGDTHLYTNHIEQAKEQISRKSYELPKVELNFEFKHRDGYLIDWDKVMVSDIELLNYTSNSKIIAPLSN